MIEILPMEDRGQEKALLEGLEANGGAARVLVMADRGEALGHVAVELSGTALRILRMEAAGYGFSQKPQGEAAFVLDSLMRAAASYGEALGARSIETAFPDFFGFFHNRGFETDGAHAFTPISTIVRYG